MIHKIFSKSLLLTLTPILMVMMATGVFARDYVIFSIGHQLPMSDEDKVITKNFYVNMGVSQGVRKGTRLDIFRIVSRLDPFDSNKRYNYKVKIGELEVIHTENDASICNLKEYNAATINHDVDAVMIGDQVGVHVE